MRLILTYVRGHRGRRDPILLGLTSVRNSLGKSDGEAGRWTRFHFPSRRFSMEGNGCFESRLALSTFDIRLVFNTVGSLIRSPTWRISAATDERRFFNLFIRYVGYCCACVALPRKSIGRRMSVIFFARPNDNSTIMKIYRLGVSCNVIFLIVIKRFFLLLSLFLPSRIDTLTCRCDRVPSSSSSFLPLRFLLPPSATKEKKDEED